MPFLLFSARKYRIIAGVIFCLFQFSIMLSGNYAWINHLTLLMIIPCFDDRFFKKTVPFLKKFKKIKPTHTNKQSLMQKSVIFVLFCFIVYLSYHPVKNLISTKQAMNRSYDQFHIVNSYGVFGSITKKRYEIIIEGTNSEKLKINTVWKEYELPCKPGNVYKRPCVIAPYHYRITWQIWFAAMNRIEYNPWLSHLVYKLLQNNPQVLELIEYNPFKDTPPKFIRLKLYRYYLSNPWKSDHKWYKREYAGTYLPAMSLESPYLQRVTKRFAPSRK